MFDNLDNQPSNQPLLRKKWRHRIGKRNYFSGKEQWVLWVLKMGWLIFSGSEPDRNEVVNYSNSNVPIGVSDTLNEEAVNDLEWIYRIT